MGKGIKASLLPFCLVGLASCTTAVEITSETVSSNMLRKIPTDRHLGNLETEVRTYIEAEDGKKTEVSGARCTLKSRDIAAQFTTPTRVETPIYVQGARFEKRGQPEPLVITCRAKGLKGTSTIEALPYGLRNTSSTTSYYYSDTGAYAGGTTVFTHHEQLSSSYPWSYGTGIKLVLAAD